MAEINDLPNELLPYIFKHLDLKDLPNCRLVEKRWKAFIDEVKIKQLVISDLAFQSSLSTWYRTDDKINSRNWITFSNVRRCPFDLGHLERLRIDMKIHPIASNLNVFLADFPKLCQLEIFYIDGGNRPFDLQLPDSLRTIHFEFVDNIKLHLDSPRLQSVFCGSDIRNINFLHPESIVSLKINHLDKNVTGGLQVFPNVEHFHCGVYSFTLAIPDMDLIKIFPQAKAIQFELGAIESDVEFVRLERVINDTIVQRNNAGRTDLNIFCDGSIMRDLSSFRRYAHKEL